MPSSQVQGIERHTQAWHCPCSVPGTAGASSGSHSTLEQPPRLSPCSDPELTSLGRGPLRTPGSDPVLVPRSWQSKWAGCPSHLIWVKPGLDHPGVSLLSSPCPCSTVYRTAYRRSPAAPARPRFACCPGWKRTSGLPGACGAGEAAGARPLPSPGTATWGLWGYLASGLPFPGDQQGTAVPLSREPLAAEHPLPWLLTQGPVTLHW